MLTAMLSCYLSENPADPKPRVHQSVFAAPFVSPHMHEGWLLNEWVLSVDSYIASYCFMLIHNVAIDGNCDCYVN